ncbi:MAG: hypothetical protein ACYC0V_05405 [Armatimonadota bacterium]
MTRPANYIFELRQYPEGVRNFTNDFVACLPGLVITQFNLERDTPDGAGSINTILRFDFVEDWYSVLAFLDIENKPTGHYVISAQSPMDFKDGSWKGDDLILKIKVFADWSYQIEGDKDFIAAIESGWMQADAAMNARETIRKICVMLNDRTLPPEVMDAVNM